MILTARIAILALLALLPTFAAAGDTPEGWRADFVASAYQEALEIFHPGELDDALDPDGELPWRRQLLDNMAGAVERAERHGLAGDPVPPEILQVMERLLLPQVWELHAREQHLPGEAELRAWFEERRGEFALPARLRGSRIIIPHGPGDSRTVERVKQMLESGVGAGRSFRDVAREYYRSLGIDADGHLGWRTAENLREDVHAAFAGADLGEPYFGPVETTAGYLFGALHERQEGRERSFAEARDDIERAWLAASFPAYREEFFSAQEIQRGLERHWPEEGLEEVPDTSGAAFTIDGEAVTWGEVVSTTRGDFGDPADPAYYPAAAERAIRNRLLYTGDMASLVRGTRMFGRLLAAVKAQWRIGAAIRAEVQARQPDTMELMDFHTRNQERLYRAPARYHVAAWSIPMNPDQTEDPDAMESARRDAWRRANLLREAIASRIPLESYTLDEDRFGPLRQSPETQWMDATMLPPMVLEAIDQLAEKGDLPAVTPPLIGSRTYYIVYLIGKEEGRLLDFADVIDSLWHDWRAERERGIRERFR